MRELYLPDTGAWIRWIQLNPTASGAGPARVYVHGLGCSGASDFAEITTHAPLAGRTSLLVDLLGHGYSDRPAGFGYRMREQAEAVAAVIEHEGLRDVELIGHSMGGAVAIELAAARPDLVAKLVVAEPNLFPGGGFVSRVVAEQDEEEFVAEGFARMVAAEKLPDYVARLRLADARALHRSATALVEGTDPSWGALLTDLDRPRAFLVGERTRPDAETDLMAAAGVPVVDVPAATHNMMIDNPQGFAEALARALEVAEPGAYG
ncbi:alpha/beta fold hydrolase [Streptomyces indicus]|uniref:Pimeloyl-ACP methyl ester carboxylesterase n=1 Tax=Streptomyces indicus TaxID=417292 RepID=A0A1G8VAL5_9ACTN|nr:alpha/beta hydrolase [Streptomyces indicus]SDJ62405.1 Pimeloyl-ACP methyl ester carboxylesterase [Streptomyces indicus]